MLATVRKLCKFRQSTCQSLPDLSREISDSLPTQYKNYNHELSVPK